MIHSLFTPFTLLTDSIIDKTTGSSFNSAIYSVVRVYKFGMLKNNINYVHMDLINSIVSLIGITLSCSCIPYTYLSCANSKYLLHTR